MIGGNGFHNKWDINIHYHISSSKSPPHEPVQKIWTYFAIVRPVLRSSQINIIYSDTHENWYSFHHLHFLNCLLLHSLLFTMLFYLYTNLFNIYYIVTYNKIHCHWKSVYLVWILSKKKVNQKESPLKDFPANNIFFYK